MADLTFAEKLYTLRKAKGLSQKEVGAFLGVSNKAVSKWETGAALPKTETLIRLAQLYDISTEELLCQATAQRQTAQDNTVTLAALAQETAAALETMEPVQNRPQDVVFTPRSSKVYLITVAAILVIGTALLTVSLLPAQSWVAQVMGIPHIGFAALMLTTMLSVLFTGAFWAVRLIKRLPSWVIVLIMFAFFMTMSVLVVAGMLLFVPSVGKSIQVLVRSKRRKHDGSTDGA